MQYGLARRPGLTWARALAEFRQVRLGWDRGAKGTVFAQYDFWAGGAFATPQRNSRLARFRNYSVGFGCS